MLKKQLTIYDFYATYEPSKNFTIKLEVQNLFDKKYINPLDSNNDSASQFLFELGVGESYAASNYTKGRTTVLSFNYKY